MRVVVAFAIILEMTGVGRGDPSPPPWANGVSRADQDRANELYAEGNKLFEREAHAPALERYRAALELWDHPLIRYNAAATLIQLDRPLEAAAHLERALAYGAEPFEPVDYRVALGYQKLLKGRVGQIEARCTQAGAKLQLDGKPWFDCPGRQIARVEVGEHTIVGAHPDLLPTTRRIVVRGGVTASEQITLLPVESLVRLEYRHPRWAPWTTTALGTVAGIGGLGLWLAARGQMRDFEDNFAAVCASGCNADLAEHPSLRNQRASARRLGTIGIASMIVGGSVAIGGIAWTIWNRERRVMPDLDVALTGDGAATSAAWRF